MKDKYVVGDDKVKQKCESSIEWSNAFILLIFDKFPETSVPIVKIQKDEEGEGSIESVILDNFIVGNNNDFESNGDIRNVINDSPFKEISKDKLATSLRAFGCYTGRKNGQRGWHGLCKLVYENTEQNKDNCH